MAIDEKARVSEYMTADVVTVTPEATVAEVASRMAEDDEHSGFPVCEGRHCRGFVTARDLLLADEDTPIAEVMSEELVVADPGMALTDAARVILRSGIQKLPVVDENGKLVGIVSNTDMVRSQIERATPEKVGKLSRTLSEIHGVETTEEHRQVCLDDLTPTQSTVYTDELQGRAYELERGLAEPLVVIDAGTEEPSTEDSTTRAVADGSRDLVLADGHHRVKAAAELEIEAMDAYVIDIDASIELGMAETARKEGLRTIADIETVDYAHHPLVETTERLQDDTDTERGGTDDVDFW